MKRAGIYYKIDSWHKKTKATQEGKGTQTCPFDVLSGQSHSKCPANICCQKPIAKFAQEFPSSITIDLLNLMDIWPGRFLAHGGVQNRWYPMTVNQKIKMVEAWKETEGLAKQLSQPSSDRLGKLNEAIELGCLGKSNEGAEVGVIGKSSEATKSNQAAELGGLCKSNRDK